MTDEQLADVHRHKQFTERHEKLLGEELAQTCRSDGRCQYAIDHGAEGLGHCPPGKCTMPVAIPEGLDQLIATVEKLNNLPRTDAALDSVAKARREGKTEWTHHDEMIKSHVYLEMDLNKAAHLLGSIRERLNGCTPYGHTAIQADIDALLSNLARSGG